MPSPGSGYGQQIPEDSNSLLSGVAFLVRQMLAQMDTMKLVQVVAVYGGAGAIAAAGTVDVLLLVNQIDGATPPNSTPSGTVYGIPWSRVAGGTVLPSRGQMSKMTAVPIRGANADLITKAQDPDAIVQKLQEELAAKGR